MMLPVLRSAFALTITSSLLFAPACAAPRGHAKAALARQGKVEASWSGGRDGTRARSIEFVVIRKSDRLATYVITIPDDGDEESAPLGFIDPDRCLYVKHGSARQIWPDGLGRWKFADMGPMEDIPSDCSEYEGTPAWPFVHTARR